MTEQKKSSPAATDQVAASEHALAAKKAGESATEAEYLKHQTDTAGEGRISEDSDHQPPMGAFDAEGHRPVVERSRKVR